MQVAGLGLGQSNRQPVPVEWLGGRKRGGPHRPAGLLVVCDVAAAATGQLRSSSRCIRMFSRQFDRVSSVVANRRSDRWTLDADDVI